jgi:hypothetical protein
MRRSGVVGIDALGGVAVTSRNVKRARCVQPPSAPTARATTSRDVSSAAVASMPINALARLLNGIVSVGLKALEFVVDTYR